MGKVNKDATNSQGLEKACRDLRLTVDTILRYHPNLNGMVGLRLHFTDGAITRHIMLDNERIEHNPPVKT